ncbi:MAG: PLP-dependent transferase [Calditrichaeota bacterium]|nr:PLP-dependent transferase [Calditrichota bacterium]MCB9087930.1 PLP-dependent transferase [Calditrichia bacterium]
MKFETRAIHVGEKPNFKDGGTGDVAMPIHLTSTYAREKVDIPTAGYEYSRTANPTRDALQQRLAALEDAQYGLVFASGLAAETSLVLSLLKAGEHIVAFDDLYGGSRRLFTRVFNERFKVEVSYVDARQPQLVADSIRDNTRLVWLETPTNPLLKLCDIEAIANIAHQHKLTVVVDNTFMSPYFQQPLALGADIVMHSTTKFLNGHSDSLGGALLLNDESLYEKIKFTQNAAGGILSPFDSYLILRGTKTLAVRMRQHQKNAIRIAKFLESHPRVNRVIYPGLESHPQHELAQKQMSGFGGMLSFELDGNIKDAKRFVEGLKYFALAESLGGVESLIELPAVMTHASVPPEERRKIGLADGLIRISAGIENGDDLLEDLEGAFQKIG